MEKLGFNSSLEEQIIANILDNPEFYTDIAEWLKPRHFINEDLAKLYAVINKHVEKYSTVPSRAVVEHYAQTLNIDLSCFNLVADNTNSEWLLEETISIIRRQELKRFIYNAALSIEEGNTDYGKLEEDLRTILSIQPTHDLGIDYFDVDTRYTKILSMDTTKIPTGLESVDKVLGGGIARKELVAIGANTGIGKSLLLTIIGANALTKGYNVVYYSHEMSEEWVSIRFDSALVGLTREELLAAPQQTKERIKQLRSVIDGHLVIKEFPTRTATVNTLRAHLKKLRERKRFIPDLIIVDYGDIMKATHTYKSRYEEQGAIFQELRGLAQEQNVPIITATQMNRGAREKSIATAEDIGDSYDKTRILDSFFVILQKPHEKLAGYFRLYDAKVRNGLSGTIHGYEVDYARVRVNYVGEVTETTDEQEQDNNGYR